MTERKPAAESFETWVDRLIREAQERGEFDNLPGKGKPIPGLGEPYDELWWVKGYMRREGLSTEALLPTSLRLRKEVSRLREDVRELPTERAVRDAVDDLNRRIADWLRAPSGPHLPPRPVNADAIVRQWRADRRSAGAGSGTGVPKDVAADAAGCAASTGGPPRLARLWRRIRRRRGAAGDRDR